VAVVKAAHIVKVRKRAEQFKVILGVTAEDDRELWMNRMAEVIGAIRGRDISSSGITTKMRRNQRRAMADALWLLVAHDLPEMCDALLAANQKNHSLRSALFRNGLDENGNSLEVKLGQLSPTTGADGIRE
jgi:hypothetical protein